MNSSKIIAYIPEGKSLINPSSNPERGYIAVKSETMSMVNGSFLKSTRYALIKGLISDLEGLGLSEGADVNVVLGKLGIPAQKIVILETTSPQWEGQAQKINKKGELQFSAEGFAIYRSTNLAPMSAEDVLIPSISLVGETVETSTALEETPLM